MYLQGQQDASASMGSSPAGGMNEAFDTPNDSGANNTSSTDQPTISLPKGGGALRGINEKFEANPATGTASLSVPIAVTPGRAGFGPQLSLSYDSGSGNGPFGLGWSLSLPVVGHRTDRGLPRYNDDHDIFLLSGIEDLVPVSSDNGTQGPPVVVIDGYTVRRYCPRVEGLFGRIEKWMSTTNTLDVHWRSITPDNVTTLYGLDDSSRIFNPRDPSHVFQWLISASYDTRGNAIMYEYKVEDSTGVPASSSEQNRTDTDRSANKYLKRIRYGNRTPGSPLPAVTDDSAWMFEVVFDYGEHDLEDPKPDDSGQWKCRQDPFSTYRATFEIRTYRLCQRVLTFHRIPEELGEPVTLVRSTGFVYNEAPNLTFLSAVNQSGHVRPSANNPSQGSPYITKSLPPTEFEYTAIPTPDELSKLTVREVESASLENLPTGVDGNTQRWVDLNGEGLPSVLIEAAGTWFYKQNTSASNIVSKPAGTEGKWADARFGPCEMLSYKPDNFSLASGNTTFMDIDGDGVVDLVQWDEPGQGYYPRLTGKMNRRSNEKVNAWAPFRPFERWPNVDQKDPNMRIVDVTGDGRADLLLAQEATFTWYPSLGEHGFGSENITYAANLHGARGSFADSDQSFYLADMTGDGLEDLVHLRNGSCFYWPNIGYGHFGSKVVMDNCPVFDNDESFDQSRVRFADIDGSGTSDLLYITPYGANLYLNNAGNSWAAEQSLLLFPLVINDVTTVDLIDLLGMGTSCLVWSSSLPGDSASPMLYLDLMNGRKPHLLTKIVNNLGAETHIHYTPSTYFSLRDAQAGKPWLTRLPFPVQCVDRVVSIDHVGKTRFISRYAYHNGCYDGYEREFRGFAAVEQWDAEEYFESLDAENYPTADFVNVDKASQVPPVHTKMWFHPGIYIDDIELSRGFATEYYGAPNEGDPTFNDFLKTLLPDSTLPSPATTLTGREMREACRALKGRLLRQEIYSDDALPNDDTAIIARARIPYSISETNFSVELIQRKGSNRYGVFFPHPLETINYQLDRNPADPRINHDLVLEVDNYGNVLRQCSVRYGRQLGQSTLQPADTILQEQLHLVYTEMDFTNKVDSDDTYLLPTSCEVRTYEVTGFDPSSSIFNITNFTNNNFALLTSLVEISFEQQPTTGIPQKRLFSRSRTLFRSDDMSTLLPVGQIQSRALPGISYNLALTPGLINTVFERTNPDGTVENLLPNSSTVLSGPEGGYVDLESDGQWWVPTGRMYFDPDPNATAAQELAMAMANFFLARRTTDSFGNSSTIDYDAYNLLIVSIEDAMQNLVECTNDYRVLRPNFLTDPNGNQAEVVFDALGMVVGSAVMGKPGENIGDSLSNFRPDLTQADIDSFYADPHGPIAKTLLGNASFRVVYDIGKYWREPDPSKKGPTFAATIARETHASDSVAEADLKLQVAVSYSDGYEREIQTKGQTDPGPLIDGGSVVNPRWICSGWTIFNNKGLPVRQYEPFFDDTHEFKFGATVGVSPIILYDPLERAVGTINPDHSWSKVVVTAWQEQTFDVNDTVLMDPKTDPDIGQYFRRLPDADYLPTWYQARVNGALGSSEQAAAVKTAAHANTPSTANFDSLGRTFLTITDNATAGNYQSRVSLDIQGNQHQVTDSMNRVVAQYDYDMLNTCLHQASMEGGERWMLYNVVGNKLYSWNSRGYRYHSSYDVLQRPLGMTMLADGASTEVLVQKIVYGDTQTTPDPRILNKRARAIEVYDQAGVLTISGYDFKGNLLGSERQLATNYKTILDWTSGTLALEAQKYVVSQTFDALNRVVTYTAPDSTSIQMTFDDSAALETISANMKGATGQNGQLIWTSFVTDIEYDAKGQRKSITFNNNTTTNYTYDPNTYRLLRLQTLQTGSTASLQDLNYTYDPIGNITNLTDDAQQTIFFRNKIVKPSNDYIYDAIYRLIQATGREHLGQTNNSPNAPTPPAAFDSFHTRLDNPGDENAMGTYVESYVHDSVGNIQSIQHVGSQPASAGWTRKYTYQEPSQLVPSSSGIMSNRLSSTTIGSTTDVYQYAGNAGMHGLMTSMPQLTGMQWDSFDQLQSTTRQKVNGNSVPETTYYVYDSLGQRIRKVTERQANGAGATTRMKESIYIGIFEVHRKYAGDGTTISLERETIHIMDDQRRVAMVQTRTQGEDGSPQVLIRYQYNNHIESACLELDDTARIISYEEYYPYGSTSYQATSNITQVPKRYRYIGKERDKENGLDYHGRRYYASWIGRWISADPGGLIDGMNLYWYGHDNPIVMTDPSGFAAQDEQVDVLTRGNYTENMSQKDVRLAYGGIGVYYTGDATWNKESQSWTVDRSQLISSQEASAMSNYWGDANPASTASADAPAAPSKEGSGGTGGTGDSKPGGDKQPGLAESFAYGLAKGFVIGVATGLVFGAIIASGGTLAILATGIGYGMAVLGAVQVGEVVVGKDLSGNDLSANERAEMAGEILGGLVGGGLGGKAGAKIGGKFSGTPSTATPTIETAPAESTAPPQNPTTRAPPGPSAETVASRTVLGKRIADSPDVTRVWDSAGKSGKATGGNGRTIFNRQRGRFWRAVRKDAAAKKVFEDAGFVFPNGKTTAPYHPSVGNNRFGRLSLDHITPLKSGGSPVDAANLKFMVAGDNSNIENLSRVIPIDWGNTQTLGESGADLANWAGPQY